MELLAFFEWWDASILAEVAKSSGGVFAVVQTVHLFSLALLGGMVIATDLRLLNLVLVEVPAVLIEGKRRTPYYRGSVRRYRGNSLERC